MNVGSGRGLAVDACTKASRSLHSAATLEEMRQNNQQSPSQLNNGRNSGLALADLSIESSSRAFRSFGLNEQKSGAADWTAHPYRSHSAIVMV